MYKAIGQYKGIENKDTHRYTTFITERGFVIHFRYNYSFSARKLPS